MITTSLSATDLSCIILSNLGSFITQLLSDRYPSVSITAHLPVCSMYVCLLNICISITSNRLFMQQLSGN